MATLLENIAAFLEENEIGTSGTDLFVGFMPDDFSGSEDNVVMIDQVGGVAPDVDLPIAKPTVQIIVRNKDHATGMAKMQAIFDLFHGMHDDFVLEEDGADIMRVFAMNEPQHMDRDEEGRDLFTCTFVFQYRK